MSTAEILGPESERRASIEAVLPLRLVQALALDSTSAIAIVADGRGDRWVVPIRQNEDGYRRALAGDGVAEALIRRLAD